MLTPIEHIEEIRKTKFSIGGQENPLTEDLHQAVKNLSAELYAKDVHFLMELIQVDVTFTFSFPSKSDFMGRWVISSINALLEDLLEW